MIVKMTKNALFWCVKYSKTSRAINPGSKRAAQVINLKRILRMRCFREVKCKESTTEDVPNETHGVDGHIEDVGPLQAAQHLRIDAIIIPLQDSQWWQNGVFMCSWKSSDSHPPFQWCHIHHHQPDKLFQSLTQHSSPACCKGVEWNDAPRSMIHDSFLLHSVASRNILKAPHEQCLLVHLGHRF